MPNRRLTSPPPQAPAQPEADLARLSEDLKTQVGMAKERISDRYNKLVESRPFEPKKDS